LTLAPLPDYTFAVMKSGTSPARRARSPRVRVPKTEPVSFIVDGKPVDGQLHKISIAGGLATLSRPVPPGSFADFALDTSAGKVSAAVEFLSPGIKGQGFRFVYLEGKDQQRLNSVLALMRKHGFGE
jgi:hypothetical protein